MGNDSAWDRMLASARHRQANRLEHNRTADAPSASDRVDTGHEKSPAETEAAFQLLNKVANYLYDDDPRATARNLNNFRQASRGMRDFVDNTPSLGRFSAALNEAGRLAKDLHEGTYPKNGLPEVRPGPDDESEELNPPVPAGDLIWAVGPLLKLLSDDQRSEIVRDVLNISNVDAKADAIAALAGYIGDLDQKDQKSLIDEAIAFFGEEGQPNTFRREMAAEAIAKAFNYLDTDHHTIIDGLRGKRSELGKLLDSHINKFEAKSLAARATHIDDMAREDQLHLIDRAIGIFGEEGKLPTFRRRKAAEAIAKAHHCLDPKQHLSKLDDIRHERPNLGKLLDSSIDKFKAKLLSAKAEHIDDLGSEDQKRLIDNAIAILREKDQLYSLEKDASDTIAKAFKYLLPDHKLVLKDLRRENGELGNTLDLSSHTFRGNLRERLERASSDRSLLERERVETIIRSIAEVIPEKLQRAQKKFIDTTRRSRERSFGR